MTSLISFSVLLLFVSFGTVISSSENNVYFVKFRNREVYATEMNHISLLRILFKFPRENLVAMRLQTSEAREYAKRPDILSVKEDEPVQLPPIYDRRSLSHEVDNSDNSLLNGEVPYGITMVQALNVSDDEVGSSKSNITVCIADSGYDSTHVDLPNGTVVTGKSFVPGQNWTEDGIGVGTHAAGTIAALQNSQGTLGVIRNGSMNLLIAKVTNNNGVAYMSRVLAGVEWCAEQGANVINLGIGGPTYNQYHSDIFKRIYEEDGVLIVAPAGVSGTGAHSYPASYESVVSVGAVNKLKNIASFSNTNDQIEMVGPGVSVYSTVPGNAYSYKTGTNIAATHVTGVAALVWSHFPSLNAALIRDVLQKSAEDLGGQEGKDPTYGYGLVRAKEAFDLLNSTDGYSLSPSVSPSEWPTSSPSESYYDDYFSEWPTISPTECSGVVLAVNLTTDNFGSETSWNLTIDDEEETILTGKDYIGNQEYYASACVEACDNTDFDLYTFSIFDTYGDGLGNGFNAGAYLVTMDGVMKAEGGGNFGYEETKQFTHSTCPQQNKNSNSAFGSSKEIHFIFLMPVLLTILFFRASDQAHTPKSYV
jgi:hypothetical protein